MVCKLGYSTATTMKRARKFLLIAGGAALILLLAAPRIYKIVWPPNDGRTPAKRREIADALFAMMHSSLTNEGDITKMDDPRIPDVIRALHPIAIFVAPSHAQIDCSNKPQEYFLMPLPNGTNMWALCAAGPPIHFGPQEVLRIQYE
jgi:hypothetical protein